MGPERGPPGRRGWRASRRSSARSASVRETARRARVRASVAAAGSSAGWPAQPGRRGPRPAPSPMPCRRSGKGAVEDLGGAIVEAVRVAHHDRVLQDRPSLPGARSTSGHQVWRPDRIEFPPGSMTANPDRFSAFLRLRGRVIRECRTRGACRALRAWRQRSSGTARRCPGRSRGRCRTSPRG